MTGAGPVADELSEEESWFAGAPHDSCEDDMGRTQLRSA
jgi:hypothetical protein